MLDALTLDQLRVLVAVVDEGSFSAAARRLQRVQSAVSHAMKALEAELDVALWDRSTRVPTLTPDGRVLVASARRVLAEADDLRRVASGLAGGLEASVSLCVDALFPVRALVVTCTQFAAEFPQVELRVLTETLGAVHERVHDGTCQIGVASPHGRLTGLSQEHVATVVLFPVVAASHALAAIKGRVPMHRLEREVQIVLSERGGSFSPDQGVVSQRSWRVADLSTKHAMLRAGLGWGNMPADLVAQDLTRGRLVRLRPAAWGEQVELPLSAIHDRAVPLGAAARWLVERLSRNAR